MSDPLTDPRAQQLLSADPGEVDTLAGQFRRVATQAEMAMHGLQGAHGDASWTGTSADAFREKLGKLPGDLQKVAQSYGDAATALTGYAGDIEPLKTQFRSLATQLHSAQAAVTTAQGSLSTAKGNLTTAQQAPKAKPSSPAVVTASTALTNAGGALSRAQGDVTGLDSRAFHVLDEFDTVRGRARSAISRAAGLAPQDNSSWFSSVVGGFEDFVKGAGSFVAGMAKSVWKAATSLKGDLVNVWNHPGDLSAWLKFGKDLGTVAGAVALTVAVVACPLDAVGFEGAAGALSGVAGDVGTATTALSAGTTAGDTYEWTQGRASFATVASDGIGLAAGAVKLPGLRSAEGTAGSLEQASAGLESYAGNRAAGQTATQAYSALTHDQKTALAGSLRTMSGSHGLQYLQSSTSAALQAAKVSERRWDAGNEFAHTIFDGGKEKVMGTGEKTGG